MKKEILDLMKAMEERGIDYFLVNTSDAHNSEYVGAHDKFREYLSGFTGSNGNLLVSRDRAYLWTDGRYFVQAARELEGSGIELMRMQEEGVPTISGFLGENMKPNQVLGFDGKTFTMDYIKDICKKAPEIKLEYGIDMADILWQDRPERSCRPLELHSLEFAGKSFGDKLLDVRKEMKNNNCNQYFLGKLDDIMWLFNIRGNDVTCNPVALCYCFVGKEVTLFVQREALTEAVEKYLEKEGVKIGDYDNVREFIENYHFEGKTLVDPEETGYLFCSLIGGKSEIVEAENPTGLLKAIKNDVEISNMKKYFLRDSVAATSYIYWLKKCIEGGMKDEEGNVLNEYMAGEKCDYFRSLQKDFRGVSFPTICAYGGNGAMMHYEATENSNAVIENKGFLLTDCGGQYPGATTDVTRTVAMGELTEDEIRDYTLSLKGMLNLQEAYFLQGCGGKNLDILARIFLWRQGKDYKCGTGHGVGYFLNVHEGPQNIRWKSLKVKDQELKPGMVVTDEPGVYVEGKYGIRIENTLLTVKGDKTGDGQFLGFEPLTLVPIDKKPIDKDLLGREATEWLDRYHRQVWDCLSPYFDGEELEWLREATLPL